MEFLVAFALDIPPEPSKSEISDRENAEAAATAKLADDRHLVRVWRSGAPGETMIVGLYRAESEAQLDGLLGALPRADWMRVIVTPLEVLSDIIQRFQVSQRSSAAALKLLRGYVTAALQPTSTEVLMEVEALAHLLHETSQAGSARGMGRGRPVALPRLGPASA
jgi:muconolactone delta-isomerase